MLTSGFPTEEKFGLTSQIRRAAVSIPSNIAEGSGRNTNKDFAQFLNVSLGSSFELESLLFLCADLNLISTESLNEQLTNVKEVQKMMYGLIKTIRP